MQKEENIKAWNRKPLMLTIKGPSNLGKDCLKLVFSIDKNSNLIVECKEYSDNQIGVFNLGSIF